MKTMKMPGFTAEASLFKMAKYYWQNMTLRPANPDGVQPAASHGWTVDQSCYDDCIDDCLNVRHGPVRPGVCIRLCRNECRRALQ